MKKNNKLNILYEDKYLIAVFKKDKIPTIKSEKYKNNLYSDVYEYLHKKNQKVFVIHRLDVDTSGIVLFAKNEKIKENLQLNWQNVKRNYIAIVHGKTKDSGVIESYIKETKDLYSYSTNDKKNGKFAQTKYKTLYRNKNYSMIEIDITTGRKNQIRVAFSSIKHYLVGDKKYGLKDNKERLYLHANRLKIYHPYLKKEILFETAIPNEFKVIMKGR